MAKQLHVVVVGAGLMGLCCAYFLRRGGALVTVVERHTGPGLGTSFANGAMLHGSLVQPWNAPGVGMQLLRSIGQADAATVVRLRALPDLLGWGVDFLAAATPERHLTATRANLRLAQLTRQLMQQLRDEEGLQYGQRLSGITVVFRDAEALAVGMAKASSLQGLSGRENDAKDTKHAWVHHRPLDVQQLVALEPALAEVAADLAGAIHYPEDEGGDAFAFCTELTQRCQRLGVVFRFGAPIQLRLTNGSAAPVVLQGADPISADAVVLAAGPQSEALARALGLRLPIRPAKGYSLTCKVPPGVLAPQQPIVDHALHAAVVPVGKDRLRVVGTAEFAGHDLSLNPQRLDNLRRLLGRLYPRIDAALSADALQPWAGLRPLSSDGVPLIGRSTVPGLWLCTGHGQLGWTLAAGSGHCLAAALLGSTSAIDAADYSPARFAKRMA